MLSSIVFVPGAARFLMSAPSAAGFVVDVSTVGLPTTKFRRTMFPDMPATRTIPFVFPVTLLSSITLSLVPGATRPMPKLLRWVAYPFPLVRFARSRLWLLPPDSHMLPHRLMGFPLRTDVFSSSVLSLDARFTKIPDQQLLFAVTRLILTPVAVRRRMPNCRNP